MSPAIEGSDRTRDLPSSLLVRPEKVLNKLSSKLDSTDLACKMTSHVLERVISNNLAPPRTFVVVDGFPFGRISYIEKQSMIWNCALFASRCVVDEAHLLLKDVTYVPEVFDSTVNICWQNMGVVLLIRRLKRMLYRCQSQVQLR